jgi:acetate kinase
MVTQLKEYTSTQAIAEALDQQLSQTKSKLGENLKRLDEIRTKAENSKKIREVVLKLAGKKATSESQSEITVEGLEIVLDANSFHVLTAIEVTVRSYQEHLSGLQKVSEALKWLEQLGDTEGFKFLVVEEGGIPKQILFRLS